MSIPDLLYQLIWTPLGGIVIGGSFVIILAAAISAEKDEW